VTAVIAGDSRIEQLRLAAVLDVDSMIRDGDDHLRHLADVIPDDPAKPFGGGADADDLAAVESILGRPVTLPNRRWPFPATLRAALRRWALREMLEHSR